MFLKDARILHDFHTILKFNIQQKQYLLEQVAIDVPKSNQKENYIFFLYCYNKIVPEKKKGEQL